MASHRWPCTPKVRESLPGMLAVKNAVIERTASVRCEHIKLCESCAPSYLRLQAARCWSASWAAITLSTTHCDRTSAPHAGSGGIQVSCQHHEWDARVWAHKSTQTLLMLLSCSAILLHQGRVEPRRHPHHLRLH
jgi:hypothetical protein